MCKCRERTEMPLPSESSIVQDHIANTQSTHTAAPSASAGCLIKLLREAYGTTPNGAEGIKRIHSYLKNPEIGEPYSQNKIQSCEQIANTLLQLGKDYWTKNQVYDPISEKMIDVDASLGEVLNLVCIALLDDQSFPEGFQSPQDKRMRIDSLINSLNYFKSHPGLCSGGIQHELLFLLNDCWRQFHAIENLDAFLYDSALSTIAKRNPSFKVLYAWINRTNNITTDDSDDELLDKWLDSTRQAVRDELFASLLQHGINPNDPSIIKKVDDLTGALNALNVPSEIPGVPQIRELMQAKPSDASLISQWDSARNEALSKVLKNLSDYHNQPDTDNTIMSHLAQDETITAMARAELIRQDILKYNKLWFIGDEGTDLKNTMHALQEALGEFWRFFVQNPTILPPELEALKISFKEKLQVFLKNTHQDWISNCFAILSQENHSTQTQLMNNLRTLHTHHSLELSDKDIHAWMQEHEGIIEIGSYEINRFLIHALLIPPNAWTPAFRWALEGIVHWLRETPEWQFQALRSAYPRGFLANLELVLRIAASEPLLPIKSNCYDLFKDQWFNYNACLLWLKSQALSAESRQEILTLAQPFFNSFILNTKDLYDFLSLPQITTEQCAIILNAITENHLSQLIQNGTELKSLLKIRVLSEEQRTKILTSVLGKLARLETPPFFSAYISGILKNMEDLIKFLSIPQLTEANRTLILTNALNCLPHMILKDYKNSLKELLALPQLTETQRTSILEAAKLCLFGAEHGGFLGELLSVSQLTEDQRTSILETTKGCLFGLRNNSYSTSLSAYSLGILFDCKELTESQRLIIWTTIKPYLNKLLEYEVAEEDRYELELQRRDEDEAFSRGVPSPGLPPPPKDNAAWMLAQLLSKPSFSVEQRTEIINSLSDRLQSIIKTPSGLKMVLGVSALTEDQRAVIRSSMPDIIRTQMDEELDETPPERTHSPFSFFSLVNFDKEDDNPFAMRPPRPPTT